MEGYDYFSESLALNLHRVGEQSSCPSFTVVLECVSSGCKTGSIIPDVVHALRPHCTVLNCVL